MNSSRHRRTPVGPIFFLTPLFMLIVLGLLVYFAIQFGYAKLEPALNLLMPVVNVL